MELLSAISPAALFGAVVAVPLVEQCRSPDLKTGLSFVAHAGLCDRPIWICIGIRGVGT